VPGELDLDGLLAKDYDEALRRVVASTYGLISGQPSSTLSFDNSKDTAYHDPAAEVTVITEQNVPEALRGQRLLKMVLLRGAAGHEAGHHVTLLKVGPKHDYSGLSGYLYEPFVWPSKPPPGVDGFTGTTLDMETSGTTAWQVWGQKIVEMRQAAYQLCEDIRANSHVEREYARTVWPSLRLLIRYTRIGWAEALRAAAQTAVEIARLNPDYAKKNLWMMRKSPLFPLAYGGGGGGPALAAEKVAEGVVKRLGIVDSNGNEAKQAVIRAHVWHFVPELFRLYFIYPPRDIDLHRDPVVDLRPDVEQYWDEVVAKFPSEARCYFPDDADELFSAIHSIRAAADVNIKQSYNPARALDTYRTVVGRYFGEIIDLTCWKDSSTDKKMTPQGAAPRTGTPSPEGEGGTQPGGSATNRAGNRDERKLRDSAKSEGNETADEEGRGRGDAPDGMDPVKRIRKWLKEHPFSSAGKKEVEQALDTYLKERAEARK
jgi:hypothetical protein